MAAAAGDGGSDGDKSAFRCIDAVRYALAAVMTVLIAAVVVKAVKVVLRPDTLDLSVVAGSVLAFRLPPPADGPLYFRFKLRARNLSGRTRMYYNNITVFLFDNATIASSTGNLSNDCITLFDLGLVEFAVLQLSYVDNQYTSNGMTRDPDTITPSFFDKVYKTGSGGVSNVTMRVDGTLVTEIRSGINKTAPYPTTYYCTDLVVNDDMTLVNTRPETTCTTRV